MNIKELLATEWQRTRQLRYLKIEFDPERCTGTWQCYEVCPVGRWTPNHEARKAILHNEIACIACGACVLQCPEDAIRLHV